MVKNNQAYPIASCTIQPMNTVIAGFLQRKKIIQNF